MYHVEIQFHKDGEIYDVKQLNWQSTRQVEEIVERHQKEANIYIFELTSKFQN